MTPKEKAEQLFNKMLNVNEEFRFTTQYMTESMAKDSALICVDEILNFDNKFMQTEHQNEYWQEVKKEIKLL